MSETDKHPLITRPDDFVLGQAHEPLALDTRALNRIAALALARQARRSLNIVSRDLDAPVYDDADFCEAVSELARSSRYALIQILVQNSEPAVKNGHRLIEIAQRLSSFVKIRKMHPRDAQYNQAWLVADAEGFIHRQKADLYEAKVAFHDPLRCKELEAEFTTLWEHAEPDPNLRRLHL